MTCKFWQIGVATAFVSFWGMWFLDLFLNKRTRVMITQDDIAYWHWKDKDPQAPRCGGESKWKTYAPTAWLSLKGPGSEWEDGGKRMGVRECRDRRGEGAGSVGEVKRVEVGGAEPLREQTSHPAEHFHFERWLCLSEDTESGQRERHRRAGHCRQLYPLTRERGVTQIRLFRKILGQ